MQNIVTWHCTARNHINTPQQNGTTNYKCPVNIQLNSHKVFNFKAQFHTKARRITLKAILSLVNGINDDCAIDIVESLQLP